MVIQLAIQLVPIKKGILFTQQYTAACMYVVHSICELW